MLGPGEHNHVLESETRGKAVVLRLTCIVKLPLPQGASRMRGGDRKGVVRWTENTSHCDVCTWIHVKTGIRLKGL